VSGDPQHWEDNRLGPADTGPELLIGTYNKLAAYQAHIYADLHHWFHRLLLKEHHTILISGYGWGDSGINQRLFQWFFLSQNKNRMVLMYKKAELDKLLESLKDPLCESLRIRIKDLNQVDDSIDKWMEDTQAKDVSDALRRMRPR
jgi:hypothetical protein